MAKKESSIIMPLLTKWGEKLNPNAPLQQYPRPQLWRQSYFNLNGVWKYAIVPEKAGMPQSYDGDIIVPFSPESVLSGVSRSPKEGEALWYKYDFYMPIGFVKDRVILNFGAVDQCCTVYINGSEVCEHVGGYIPFSADITDFLQNGKNTIQVEVYDDTENSIFTYGKQSTSRGGIWYTAQSGIWQTVWLESVPKIYVKELKITPLYDEACVDICIKADEMPFHSRVQVYTRGVCVAVATPDSQGCCRIHLPDFTPWTPENPFLYDVRILFGDDRVESYFAMRKFSAQTDAAGNLRFMLNNKPVFLSGLLDQGYWSDGLYTAPSDEALIYDIKTMKRMGFNMVRKHIKIEPLRWYYHCDRLGMIVIQDIPSGGDFKKMNMQVLPFLGVKLNDSNYSRMGRKSRAGREMFFNECMAAVDLLYNVCSIAVWTVFNEGWGQFDSLEICENIWQKDPTRLVDHASGWHDQDGSDFKSRHVYFKKVKLKSDKKRILALSEFGGYSMAVKGHIPTTKPFGYKMYSDEDNLYKGISDLYLQEVLPYIKKGLCLCVYTQLSDVEDEVNGLVTFDRKYEKAEPDKIAALNKELYAEAASSIVMQLPESKKKKAKK